MPFYTVNFYGYAKSYSHAKFIGSYGGDAPNRKAAVRIAQEDSNIRFPERPPTTFWEVYRNADKNNASNFTPGPKGGIQYYGKG